MDTPSHIFILPSGSTECTPVCLDGHTQVRLDHTSTKSHLPKTDLSGCITCFSQFGSINRFVDGAAVHQKRRSEYRSWRASRDRSGSSVETDVSSRNAAINLAGSPSGPS